MAKEKLSYENIDCEFKELYVSDIKKTVVAFANTEGGVLYIGVKDNGEIVGVTNVDEVMQQVSNALKDAIAPDVMPFVSIRAESRNERNIIEIVVQTGSSRPYYIREKGLKPSGVYVRKGSSNQPLSDEGIRLMLIDTNGKSYESLRSMQQNLTFNTLEKHFSQHGLPLNRAQMQTLKLIGDDGLYTNLALLLSEQCEHSLKVAVFQGSDKAVFRDRREFTGSLLQQLYDVYAFIAQYNKTKATFSGLERHDVKDYPAEAVREVLLNCLVHRDYSFSGSTLINIYDDRIEFISLGGLVSGLKMETIFIGVSQSRNPALAAVFYRLHLIESFGTGIEKIQRSYAIYARKPEFIAVYGGFKVVLPNVNEEGKACFMVSERQAAGFSVLDEKEQVLKLLDKQGYITRKQVEAALGVKTTKAFNVLQELCDAKKIIPVGVGRSRKYILRSSVNQ